MRVVTSLAFLTPAWAFGGPVTRRGHGDFGFDASVATASCKTCDKFDVNKAPDAAIGNIGENANFQGTFDDYLSFLNSELDRALTSSYTSRRSTTFPNGACEIKTASPAGVVDTNSNQVGPNKATKAFVFNCEFSGLDESQLDTIMGLYGTGGQFSVELDPTYIPGEQTCYFKDGLQLNDFEGNLCRTRFETSIFTGDRELFFLSGSKRFDTADEECTVYGIPSVRAGRNNWIDVNLGLEINRGVTYEWCKYNTLCTNIATAKNLFPSGDRVCVSKSPGPKTVRVQHIIASAIGALVDTRFDPNDPDSSDISSNGQIDAYETEAKCLNQILFEGKSGRQCDLL